MMVQVAAALLFTLAAGIGLMVIVTMIKSNADAILSALVGDGAFAIRQPLETDPTAQAAASRRTIMRREPSRALRPIAYNRALSRAA